MKVKEQPRGDLLVGVTEMGELDRVIGGEPGELRVDVGDGRDSQVGITDLRVGGDLQVGREFGRTAESVIDCFFFSLQFFLVFFNCFCLHPFSFSHH